MLTKSKSNYNQEIETKDKPMPIIDFMPGWAKDEKCFRDAVLRDSKTKKIVEGGWPRQKPTEQAAYENWLAKVVNQETGQFHSQRNEEGIPVKGTGPAARYVITVITRVRDTKSKSEYLTTKGALIGYDVSGIKVERHIKEPEKWRKTVFAYERSYNEKTGEFTVQTIGPSGESHDVYDVPFTPENVQKLFDKVEDENVMFVLKDIKTGEARSLSWSSVKDSLDLFCNKSFEYLWKAGYMPPPVKQELRQEAIAQGLIHGVASDYQVQQSQQPTYTS